MALEKKEEDPSFDINAERDKIFREEAGLSFDFVHNTLMRIYLEENPEDKKAVNSGWARVLPPNFFLPRQEKNI